MASILASNALTTAAVASAQISNTNPTTDAALLERFINVASSAIEAYCNRLFAKNTAYEETLEPPAGEELQLSLLPVASITSIKLDGSALDGYELDDAANGIVWLEGGWSRGDYSAEIRYGSGDAGSPSGARRCSARRVLVAKYSGGYILPKDVSAGPPAVVQTLPQDLEQACIMVVASLWRRRGVDIAVAEYNGTNEAIGRGAGGIIPDPVRPLLNPWRRIWS